MGTVSYLGWSAKYPGVCENCGGRFPEGVKIRWVNPDEGQVAHVKCPEDDEELPSGRRQDACPDCHTIHRGDCW